MSKIAILMATYNGEKYISCQIESIINQTNQEWVLYIRDDCSTDGTPEIIYDYSNRYPDKVVVVENNSMNFGCINNFFYLIQNVEADYYMLSDQDDIWKKDKIEITIGAMREDETVYGKQKPILVHTDLEVVDQNMNTISGSFMGFSNINIFHTTYSKLINTNVVTGCTTLFNRSLRDMVVVPTHCEMHDYWLALIAQGCGMRHYVDTSTIKYRQHVSNQLGAQHKTAFSHIVNAITDFKEGIRRTYIRYAGANAQFCEFYDMYQDNIHEEYRDISIAVALMKKTTIIKRFFRVMRYHLTADTIYDSLCILMFYLFGITK